MIHVIFTLTGINLVAHPASYPMDTGGSFPGGEAYYSPPSSAEDECMVLYTHSPRSLHGMVLRSTGATLCGMCS